MTIDKETYKAGSLNYHAETHTKKQIIIGESLRADSNHIKRWQKKEFGESKAWATYTISRKGEIFEHFDPKYYSDFMGNHEIDKVSVSVVLENMGALRHDYVKDQYFNWCREECSEKLAFYKEWKEFKYWEKHNQAQTNALIDLCKKLCEEHGIQKDNIGFNFFSVETCDFYGIVCRSNYSLDYNDLNPSFDFKYFLKKLGIKY